MRAIDADALMDYLQIIPIDLGYREIDDVEKYVREMPTIEPERKKGKWIDETFNALARVHHPYHPYKCDQCGEHSETNSNFCPNCGAMMTEVGTGR